MGSIQRQTILGTGFSYAGILVGFLTTGLLLPTVLEPDQNGLIQLLMSYAIILTQFANLGINGAGGRYFPYFRNYERGHGGFLLLSLSLSIIGFSLATAAVLVFKDQIQADNQAKSALFSEYYLLLLPLTFATLFFNLFDNYARLLYDSVTGTFLKDFLQRFIFLGVVLAYWQGLISFPMMLAGWLSSYLISLLLMMASLIRDGHFMLAPRHLNFPPDLRRSLFRYAGLTLMTGLSTQVIQHVDKLMINEMKGLSSTGVYGISAAFGSVIAAPATMLYKVSGVVIADAWKTNNMATIRSVYQKSCLSQLVIGCLAFVGIAANLPNIFQFLKPAYEAGYFVILWLGFGKLVDMATGVNGQILGTSRRYAWDSAFNIGMVIITIAITPSLIRAYGIEGAAIGAVIATVLFNAARTGFVWYVFGFQPFSWRNGAVVVLGAAVWLLASLPPYLAGSKVLVITDIAARSAGIVVVYLGTLLALRLYPDLNALLVRLWASRGLINRR
ncbi:lipopolysaccharide biosynthesis protein [Fibrella forsythiae]|uniref:Lipopolysaccharide biosynthesis protein n=1 Tax=Fibrella forsythiae TaxID=2817061 RepID=A0ABS3JPG4_9BACT|nr:lipopolysaccharide biosynthesis protein [Fibrella forsythiae]MBO0951893.1 lipopolysaccharide biosynthesis protein [Fibrella forsythiae]